MDKVKKVFGFLRIIDSDGQISLTNVALMIVLYKLGTAYSVSFTEIGALFIALANYAGKKVINNANQTPTTDAFQVQIGEMQKKLEETTTQVSSLAILSGLKKVT